MFRNKKTTPARKSFAQEWLDSLLFAVIAATIIRFLTFEAYSIPTPSMERSLMVGDYLFVSKLHYGARTPKTPLQIPLTHQKIWGTDIPSYSPAIQLPMFRLPGFTTVKRGDVVVFNFPPPKPGEPDYPVDLRTYLIKRCIGTPGDVVTIKQETVFVNGKLVDLPAQAQSSYLIRTHELLDERFFRRYGIVNDFKSTEGPFINWQPVYDQQTPQSLIGYEVIMPETVAQQFRTFDWVSAVEPTTATKGVAGAGIYGGIATGWNRDNFGPLTIPKAGVTVPINRRTIALYGPVIQRYDNTDKVVMTDSTISVNGRSIASYTFKQDYYFMMGDSRHNSDDSRYWGFVPADHIVGKAVFVWMSVDPTSADIWHKIRWNRLFRTID